MNVKLSSGENVGIKMQTYVEKHFMTRMLTYWSHLFLQPIERGQEYHQVKPSYMLAFILFNMFDRWCYIIKHSAKLTAEQVEYLSQDGETKMALEHLVEVSKEEKEYWKAIHKGRREWEEQLRKEQMREEEIEKIRVQGMEEKQREIALSMLQKGYEISEISKVTDLSVAEIEQLNGKTAD